MKSLTFPRSRTFLSTATVFGSMVCLSFAARPRVHFAGPTAWPVERMVENLARVAEANPDDPRAQLELGRVHSLAFTLESKELGLWHESPLRVLDDHQQRAHYGRGKSEAPEPEAMLEHVRQGAHHLQRAIDLAPQDGLAHYSLGHLTEKAAHLAGRFDANRIFRLPQIRITKETHDTILENIDSLGSSRKSSRRRAMQTLQKRQYFLASLPSLQKEATSSNRDRSEGARELLRRFWIEQAIANYRTAMDIAFPKDLQLENKPLAYVDGDSLSQLVSYEAGSAWVRLVAERNPIDEAEEEKLKATRAALKKLEDLPPPNFITPLILPFDRHSRLDDLLLTDHPVLFDLDGNGVEEPWPWVRPGVGFLVWDPEREGRITSARQMFGTASAQLFFADGYRALAALDDDGDGSVAEGELEGLAVWFDENCDGRSQPGEVRPAGELGIASLASESNGHSGRSLVSTCGVTLRDGRILPSYDWVTGPWGARP